MGSCLGQIPKLGCLGAEYSTDIHRDPTNFTEMVFTGMQKSFPYLPYDPLAVFHYKVWKAKHSISQFL